MEFIEVMDDNLWHVFRSNIYAQIMDQLDRQSYVQFRNLLVKKIENQLNNQLHFQLRTQMDFQIAKSLELK